MNVHSLTAERMNRVNRREERVVRALLDLARGQNDLRVLLAISTHGLRGVCEVARQLGITQSAASHAVAKLEAQGLCFAQSRRVLRLTNEGLAMASTGVDRMVSFTKRLMSSLDADPLQRDIEGIEDEVRIERWLSAIAHGEPLSRSDLQKLEDRGFATSNDARLTEAGWLELRRKRPSGRLPKQRDTKSTRAQGGKRAL